MILLFTGYVEELPSEPALAPAPTPVERKCLPLGHPRCVRPLQVIIVVVVALCLALLVFGAGTAARRDPATGKMASPALLVITILAASAVVGVVFYYVLNNAPDRWI